MGKTVSKTVDNQLTELHKQAFIEYINSLPKTMDSEILISESLKLVTLEKAEYSVDMYYSFERNWIEIDIFPCVWIISSSCNPLDQVMNDVSKIIDKCRQISIVRVYIHSTSFNTLFRIECLGDVLEKYLLLKVILIERPLLFRPLELKFIQYLIDKSVKQNIRYGLHNSSLLSIGPRNSTLIISQDKQGLRLSHHGGQENSEMVKFVYENGVEFQEDLETNYKTKLNIMPPSSNVNILRMNVLDAVSTVNVGLTN